MECLCHGFRRGIIFRSDLFRNLFLCFVLLRVKICFVLTLNYRDTTLIRIVMFKCARCNGSSLCVCVFNHQQSKTMPWLTFGCSSSRAQCRSSDVMLASRNVTQNHHDNTNANKQMFFFFLVNRGSRVPFVFWLFSLQSGIGLGRLQMSSKGWICFLATRCNRSHKSKLRIINAPS